MPGDEPGHGGTADAAVGTVDAATRGRLTIDEKVVRRIAERAAADVAGRGAGTSVRERLGGQTLPRATATVVGRHVRLGVDVAAPAGRTLPDLAHEIRDAVARQVGDLTGLAVDMTDVRVQEVGRFRPEAGAEQLPAAAPPAAPGAARKAGLVVAFVLLVLGAAAIYDALVQLGAFGGQELVGPLLERLDGLTPSRWMTPAGAALALIGLWLVVSALRRRPHRSLPLSARTGVYATRGAVEELGIDTAVGHGGVLDAKASARSRAVTVRVTTDGEAETAGEVRQSVTERLSRLATPPKIQVGARRKPGQR